jgi:hypothetical protein
MKSSRHHRDIAKPIKAIASGSSVLRLEKLGVSRFDLSDPYHLALALTWRNVSMTLHHR